MAQGGVGLQDGGRRLKPQSVAELKAAGAGRLLTTGCAVLDTALGGGIATGSITELSGEAGAGKSQLCLQLLLTVQLPVDRGGLEAEAVYISTEGDPAIARFTQLQQQLSARHTFVYSSDRVYMELVSTVEQLFALLERTSTLCATRPVRLIVIDSIAALFRGTTEVPNYSARAEVMFHLAAMLKCIAAKYHAVVVVTNQVTTWVKDDDDDGTAELDAVPVRQMPALGMAWTHCINERMFLWKSQHANPDSDTEPLTRRHLAVVLSPRLPPTRCEIVIQTHGVNAVQT